MNTVPLIVTVLLASGWAENVIAQVAATVPAEVGAPNAAFSQKPKPTASIGTSTSPSVVIASSKGARGSRPYRQPPTARCRALVSAWLPVPVSSPSTQRRPCQKRLVNEPSPSRNNFKRCFFRCQCRVVSGWFCETVVSRKHENAGITGSYGSTPYGPQFRASENTGPERTLWGHSLARLVERAARITPENNGKIWP